MWDTTPQDQKLDAENKICIKPECISHPQAQKSLWNGSLCQFPSLTDHWNEEGQTYSEGICFGIFKNS